MKKVINMNKNEARKFFLKKESYFNLELPEYFNFENILNQILNQVGNVSDLNVEILENMNLLIIKCYVIKMVNMSGDLLK